VQEAFLESDSRTAAKLHLNEMAASYGSYLVARRGI
jgi:hypothetical protein